MVRRILVAMDGSAHGHAAASLAIAWARRHGADLVGLGVFDEGSISGPEPVPLGGAAYKHERDALRAADAHRRIAEFLGAFAGRCEAARVACTVLEDLGTPHEQIVLEAEGCDLVMLGKQTNFHFETQDQPDQTLSRVLRACPRPVVVVPRDHTDGEGVLVAYGPGREVTRTVQSVVMLGLARGERVDVLAVASDRAQAERRLRRVAAYLAAHDVDHQLVPMATNAAPAEVILDEVRRRRARLLVMGAHGHHPVRDLFFTSVTRTMLKDATVPVLVGT
jgi:nucleotide-binding universal stress UspA family protein